MSRRLLIATMLAGALCAAAPAQAAPVSSHAMVHTCCTPPAMKESILAEARASGAEFVRVDVELNDIFEDAGSRERPDWRALDELIRLARRHDVKLLGVLLGMPTWLSDCPELGERAPLCAARDPAEFGRLAGEVAAHAGAEVGHWQILNEPDARWAFRGSPEDYARMLSAAHRAIGERAPGATVVMGGVERPRERGWIRRVMATGDAARSFDVAAIHLRLRLRGVLADLPAQLTAWRELLAGHGFDGPLWVTEHGYPADPAFQWDPAFRGGEAEQAAFLGESVPMLAQAGADQVFLTLRDNLWGEYLSEGIVHIGESGIRRKPAFAVAQDISGAWDAAGLLDAATGWWL